MAHKKRKGKASHLGAGPAASQGSTSSFWFLASPRRMCVVLILLVGAMACAVVLWTLAFPLPRQAPRSASGAVDFHEEKRKLAPATIQANVVAEYPHNVKSFTQGLTFHEGRMLESVGLYGKSWVGEVELATGNVVRQRKNDPKHFGEGVAVVTGVPGMEQDVIVQLTWREHVMLVYTLDFELLRAVPYPPGVTQGWGLAFDGTHLILSDGSAWLHWLDPTSRTFAIVHSLRVEAWLPDSQKFVPVPRLNELEVVDGLLFSNIWFDDRIAIVLPSNGQVIAWLDCSGVYPRNENAWRNSQEAVLNGIAFDRVTNRLYLTGKLWPRLVEVEKPTVPTIHST